MGGGGGDPGGDRGRGGGGTHILGHTGVYRSNDSLFYPNKSLNMGPTFYHKKCAKNTRKIVKCPKVSP